MEQPTFPPFSLSRLLTTVFAPKSGERIGLLIDLPNLELMRDFAFLQDKTLTVQRHAYHDFYRPLKEGLGEGLNLQGGEIYAYRETGGSNLDLPDLAVDSTGKEYSLEKEIYPRYDIILCLSTYSATAPLTAHARRFGFRGATLHGVNEIILQSGLAVDYNEVSRQAEKLRRALTKADSFEIDFGVATARFTLKLECGRQEAQKSHGLCRGEQPDVANLPAGEVYFVPRGAEGRFPLRYPDGTIGIMEVNQGRVQQAVLLQGNASIIEAHNQKLAADPVTGELGELGFGTQRLPVSGRDIQDEKILGTLHVATGRSDHLGGALTPERFASAENATHDDILFSPSKTPEIAVPQVRMFRDNQMTVILEDYQPTDYLQQCLA